MKIAEMEIRDEVGLKRIGRQTPEEPAGELSESKARYFIKCSLNAQGKLRLYIDPVFNGPIVFGVVKQGA